MRRVLTQGKGPYAINETILLQQVKAITIFVMPGVSQEIIFSKIRGLSLKISILTFLIPT